MATKGIFRFSGPYEFLSNFHNSSVVYEGITYPTAEHAFQAAKSNDKTDRNLIARLKTPGQAKRAGRKVRLRANWEVIKVEVMREILRDKFTRHPHLAGELLDTGDAMLVEGNYWGDRFWGCERVGDNWVGQNYLGRLLMELRTELAEEGA